MKTRELDKAIRNLWNLKRGSWEIAFILDQPESVIANRLHHIREETRAQREATRKAKRAAKNETPFDVAMRLGDWRDAKVVLTHYRAFAPDELKKGLETAFK